MSPKEVDLTILDIGLTKGTQAYKSGVDDELRTDDEDDTPRSGER